MLNPLIALAQSRKFWLAVAGVVVPAILAAFDVGPEIGESILTLAFALIAAITVEDAAAKVNGNHR